MDVKVTLEDIVNIEKELHAWRKNLNTITGPIAFTIALAILSLPYFWVGLIASAVALYMTYWMSSAFDKSSVTLEKIKRQYGSDKYSREVVDYVNNNFFLDKGYRVFTIGYWTLSLVFLWHFLVVILFVGVLSLEPWIPSVVDLHEWIVQHITGGSKVSLVCDQNFQLSQRAIQ